MKHLAKLNLAQRIVIGIAFGIAVVFVGDWITARYTVSFGWVAYAPLSTASLPHRGDAFAKSTCRNPARTRMSSSSSFNIAVSGRYVVRATPPSGPIRRNI